jgi:hypothetical protein
MKSHVRKKIGNSIKIIGFIWVSQSMYGEDSHEQTFVLTGSSSRFFVVMDGKESVATCYRAEKPGIVKQVWETRGWYSYHRDLFLSRNGRSLVRVLEIFAEKDPIEYANQIAIEIYVDGNISNRYRVKDLVNLSAELPDPPQIQDRGIKLLKKNSECAGIITIQQFHSLGDMIRSEKWEPWFAPLARTHDAQFEFFWLGTSQDMLIVFDLNDGKILYKEKFGFPPETLDAILKRLSEE